MANLMGHCEGHRGLERRRADTALAGQADENARRPGLAHELAGEHLFHAHRRAVEAVIALGQLFVAVARVLGQRVKVVFDHHAVLVALDLGGQLVGAVAVVQRGFLQLGRRVLPVGQAEALGHFRRIVVQPPDGDEQRPDRADREQHARQPAHHPPPDDRPDERRDEPKQQRCKQDFAQRKGNDGGNSRQNSNDPPRKSRVKREKQGS